MRNSEVVKLVESVNNVVHNEKIAVADVLPLARWAQMGIEEEGSTSYRIIKILVAELQEARDIALMLGSVEQVVNNSSVAVGLDKGQEEGLILGQAERTIVSEEEETALDTGLDDESQLVEDPLSMGASSYGL